VQRYFSSYSKTLAEADRGGRRNPDRSKNGQPYAAQSVACAGVTIGLERMARMMRRMGIEALYRSPTCSKPAPVLEIPRYWAGVCRSTTVAGRIRALTPECRITPISIITDRRWRQHEFCRRCREASLRLDYPSHSATLGHWQIINPRTIQLLKPKRYLDRASQLQLRLMRQHGGINVMGVATKSSVIMPGAY
jgi:hypothetical protein